MSHLVLYRNFRPKTFNEVIGQDHIVKTLTSQVSNGSFGHAYLFCGTRGTGKTSCAKIFARGVNCQNPQNGNPCGKCDACLSNLNGGNLDIVEIDAASNNRVDEIRDLREKVGYLPSVNKFKVYIVDEVHMLTDSAFNALLKTLEEPPAHAIFILATTEPHKLPATILSRCMRFDFKLVNVEDLINHLKYVFDKSGICYDEESLKLIADAGEGSVRDTLSVAEMCSAYCNNNISYEKCLDCLGITDTKTLSEILSAIFNKNAQQLLNTLYALNRQGKNFAVLNKDIIKALNNILIIKLTPNANSALSLPSKVYEEYKQYSNSDANKILGYLKKLNDLDYLMKQSSNIPLLTQTTLLELIYQDSALDDINLRLLELEKKTVDNKNLEKNNEKTQKIEQKTQKIEENLQNFEKNNNDIIDETKLKTEDYTGKKLFGEVLNLVRKNNFQLLYAMLGDTKKIDFENNILTINAGKASFDGVKNNIKKLNDIIKQIDANLQIEVIEFNENQTQSTEDFLKQKFGNNIKIKE